MNGIKGKLEKVLWQDVQKETAKVNPEFAKIIDALNPDENHWLIKATYPYGAEIMEKSILMLPNDSGTLVPITDKSLDSAISEALGYNLNSNPVSLILKNTFEIYLSLPDRTIPLNGLIYPGTPFGASHILLPKKSRQAVFIWNMSSGARTTFMLPKITEIKRHKQLEKEFGLLMPVPRSALQHWDIFRSLANRDSVKEKWEAQILFFPKQWFEHLKDRHWKNFYRYFHNFIWGGNDLANNYVIWDLVFSLILKDYEIRPSAYILDTVKYLLYMGVGAFAGLAPAQDNLGGPFDRIQDIYETVYGFKGYAPTIIQPSVFNPENENSLPVYYSLRHPVAFEFKQNTRARVNLISDLHEILSLMNRYERELLTDKFNVSQTALGDVFEMAKYDYFHNNVELHSGMRDSAGIFKEDKRFLNTIKGKKYKEYPGKCSFIRGCIRVSSRAKPKKKA